MCVCLKRQNKRGICVCINRRYYIDKDPAILSRRERDGKLRRAGIFFFFFSSFLLFFRQLAEIRMRRRENTNAYLADIPPGSETTGSIRACRRHMRNATWSDRPTTRRTMPCYRNPWSGMSRMANGRAQEREGEEEGGVLYLHPRLHKSSLPRSTCRRHCWTDLANRETTTRPNEIANRRISRGGPSNGTPRKQCSIELDRLIDNSVIKIILELQAKCRQKRGLEIIIVWQIGFNISVIVQL